MTLRGAEYILFVGRMFSYGLGMADVITALHAGLIKNRTGLFQISFAAIMFGQA